MKSLKSLGFFLLVFSSIFLIQCTTDPIPGVPGEDGADGLDGMDGVNGTTECAACHNVSTSEAVHASYLFSKHASGDRVYGRESCKRCHSNEGFIDLVTTGMVSEGDIDNATKVSCTTCHDMHTSFDFETDGYDYALRTLDPVNLIVDENYAMDFEGTSNICANCHQPRSSGPVDNGLGLFEVPRRFGPHHGPQSTMLEGIQGAEIAGSVDYPEAGSARHRTGSSCTNCHMGETSGQIDGNHTWHPTPNACVTCHTNGAPEEVDGFEEDMDALLALLEAEGILESEINEDGELEVDAVEGTFPILVAEAAWNYLFVMEDQSHGQHNPKYAKALIKNSIEALNAD